MRAVTSGLKSLLSGPSAPKDRHFQLPDFGGTVYAVGDIHGCLDELLSLEAMIAADAAASAGPHLLVYLGDYVDRGPNSAGVIEHLLAPTTSSLARFFLQGNHEVMMRDFLTDPLGSNAWLDAGGAETLLSYGIEPEHIGTRRLPARLLLEKIPESHRQFIASGALTLQVNRCFFVHAGLRAGVPIVAQRESDLLWMRPADTETPADRSHVVIHGHTIVTEPEIIGNRIAIDTGVYTSGRLTAVRLGIGGVRFLMT